MAIKPFTRFKLLRSEIQDLGVGISSETKQRISQLSQGVALNQKEPFCTKNGIYDVLLDGSVMPCYIHIPHRDIKSKSNADPDSQSSWHKYHLLWCRACKDFPRRMRKYTRADGSFYYSVSVDSKPHKTHLDEGGRELSLCKLCEHELVKCGLLETGESRSLKHFLLRDIKSLNLKWVIPVGEYDKIPNVYSEDWGLISKSFRHKRNWQCERCRIDLSNPDNRHFLHTHHRDNLKQNNSIFNLEALCIRCHAKEHPNNKKLNKSPDLQKFNLLFKDPDKNQRKPSEYLSRRGIDRIFHFTDTRNLEKIKAHGLLARKLITLKKLSAITGGNEQSLSNDQRLGLDHYVHLSLIANHPMEYQAKKRGSIEKSIYLEIDVKALDVKGCLSCKMVATAANAERLPINEGLPKLDLDILKSLNPDYKDPRYQNARKSELMVPDHIPTSMILNLD